MLRIEELLSNRLLEKRGEVRLLLLDMIAYDLGSEMLNNSMASVKNMFRML